MNKTEAKKIATALRAAAAKLSRQLHAADVNAGSSKLQMPTAQEVYKKYLAPSPASERGKGYVFNWEGPLSNLPDDAEPDFFNLLEAVGTDLGVSSQDPVHEEMNAQLAEVCEQAIELWASAQQDRWSASASVKSRRVAPRVGR